MCQSSPSLSIGLVNAKKSKPSHARMEKNLATARFQAGPSGISVSKNRLGFAAGKSRILQVSTRYLDGHLPIFGLRLNLKGNLPIKKPMEKSMDNGKMGSEEWTTGGK